MNKTDQTQMGFHLRQTYTQLPPIFYEFLKPQTLKAPSLVVLNEELAAELGLNGAALANEEGLAILSGTAFAEGTSPLAQAYAGHQFGQFTRLGDGRALLIGEQLARNGEWVDLQLKGSGPSGYSRRGDGKAAIGPMLREYLISEALFALGIPTTRSLSVILTGETIQRETRLPGAVLCRVAKSHLRVGTFEFAASTGDMNALKALADYAIERHEPQVLTADRPYLEFFKAVVSRQATLIAQWQLIGFVHGVMNTDNMTISGESIDFGPCAFMDTYSLGAVFSSIDTQGRYAYGNQPGIGQWNLSRFAEAMLPLIHEDQEEALVLVKSALGDFAQIFQAKYFEGLRAKLGFKSLMEDDEQFIVNFLKILEDHEGDYSLSFMDLSLGRLTGQSLYETDAFREWHGQWTKRVLLDYSSLEEAQSAMKLVNPSLIPRNHLVESALKAASERGDLDEFHALLQALKKPFDYTDMQIKLNQPPLEPKPYRTYCGT